MKSSLHTIFLKERMTKMKKADILKKIGGIALSAAVMVTLGALVFVTDDSKLTAIADGSNTGNSGSSGGSSEATTNESNESKESKTVEQKMTEKIDVAVDKAVQEAAAAGKETGSVRIDGRELGISTLSRDTIKLLSDSKVDAVFSFDYKGYHYVLTIPAGATPLDDDIPWYGPMYLMSLYGQTATVTPIA